MSELNKILLTLDIHIKPVDNLLSTLCPGEVKHLGTTMTYVMTTEKKPTWKELRAFESRLESILHLHNNYEFEFKGVIAYSELPLSTDWSSPSAGIYVESGEE